MSSAPPSQKTTSYKLGTNHTIATMIIPPDGGWGWVVVFTGFLAYFVTDGISYCFFLFQKPMERDLSLNPGDISLLISLFSGFYFIGGIVSCSIGNYCGFRTVMVTGATLLGLTLASGYVFDKFWYYLGTVGVIGGFGAGSIFAAATLPTGFYFDRKRSIACGLVSCGAGAGAVVLPHATEAFMNHYGWRLTYLFHAILILAGLLIRPLKPVTIILKRASLMSERRHSSQEYLHSIFTVGADDLFSKSTIISDISHPIATIDHQTILEAAHDHIISVIVRDDPDYNSTVERLQTLIQSKDPSQPSVSTKPTTIEFEREVMVEMGLPWFCCGCCRSCRYQTLPERPLLRTDLLYAGSLHRLHEYTSVDKELDYHMQVTKVPIDLEIMQNLAHNYTYWCCQNILSGIKNLIDSTLLKKPTFLCLALSGFAHYLAFFLPFFFGRVHLENIGEGKYATTLVSIIGLGSMTGRISSGIVVTATPKFGARSAASFTAFLASLAVIATTIYDDMAYQLGCMLVYGMAVGFFAPLRSIIIVDFLGLNALTSATGMCLLFQCCGSFLSAPLAEATMRYTNNKNAPYYLCGGALMFSSVVLWPMRILQRWENK